jgi:tRNA (mo5U34)-methyltransferase
VAPDSLRSQVESRSWYHTLELAPGLTTPGMFDHGPYVSRYGLPDDLSGKRALDVGTLDGFWAFELERRGAEVTALDVDDPAQLDWPPRLRARGVARQAEGAQLAEGGGFAVAAQALGSRVERVPLSVYEATPERIGQFDIVFCGSLLIHLRDPMLALERLAHVCRGSLILAEEYSRRLDLLPIGGPAAEFRADTPWMTWWIPSSRAWLQMVRCAGFEDVRRHSRFRLAFRDQRGGVPHIVVHARGPADG